MGARAAKRRRLASDQTWRAVSAFTEHGAKLYLPFYEGLVAELGCEGQSADLAVTRVDGALALSEQTRQHWIYPFLTGSEAGYC